jgi:hypothetical protein
VPGERLEGADDGRVLVNGPLPRSAIEATVTRVVSVSGDEDDACR